MKTLLLIVVLTFCSSPLVAQQKRFKIDVKVTSDNDIKADIESYLKRELRSLGDVEVGTSGDYILFVSVIKTQTQGGALFGYAGSYSAAQIISCAGSIYLDFVDARLYAGGRNDLRKLTEGVVTDFDSTILEEKRKVK
jgi:hypothetical protein